MKPRPVRTRQFDAPWARSVKLATTFVLVLVVGLAVVLLLVVPRRELWAALVAPGIAVVILGITALFCVRRYTIRHRELWIHRSFWTTRLPLKDLERAYADPEAMNKTIRACGNGGFMSYTGWFRNKKLGTFRAFVTDPGRCVVLEFPKRKVVVSPDDPAGFVRALGFVPEETRGRVA